MIIAAALAPNLHYGLSLAFSPHVAQLSIWSMVGLYLLIVVAARQLQITKTASMIVLTVALLLVASTMAFDRKVKAAIATSIGFYADTPPWVDEKDFAAPRVYRNPFGGYTLQIPRTWNELPGPIEGTSEFVLRSASAIAARLRPVCDVTDDPLPITVAAMITESTHLKRSCDHWRGLEACLLEREMAARDGPATPVRWEWLGRDPKTGAQIRLMFDLYNESARDDALAIINSARAAELSFAASPCPNPIEWAEEFVSGDH